MLKALAKPDLGAGWVNRPSSISFPAIEWAKSKRKESAMKTFLGIPLAVAAVIATVFLLGLLGLGYYQFFGPRYENVRREVFENTQSYVQGKIQDLAKYHDEHQRADTQDGKDAIRFLIQNRFAEFDETKIKAAQLRAFLIQMRGY